MPASRLSAAARGGGQFEQPYPLRRLFVRYILPGLFALLIAGPLMAQPAATEMADTMLRDGLMDAFHGYHMGQTAENVREQEGVFDQVLHRVMGKLREDLG